ncbi:MAG: hydantoinase/oxoprolinase family protein [Acidimicrobiaceae bacterium]|nr:hydantoinase/oxoprolinase family protein [Acidimicrobiaceae bacterium]
MSLVIATDIGGTFTDLVAFDTETRAIVHAKSHTEPEDLTAGILRCLRKSGLQLEKAGEFVHGSTIAINTAIERKGAVTALLVTRGTRDVYSIGRGNRPESYNLMFRRPQPYVPRYLTFEIDERLSSDGTAIIPLDTNSVRTALRAALEGGSESIAVCLLHSYVSPRHELLVAEEAQSVAPDTYISLSHEILREYREYERISTTVLNAYIGPKVSEYISNLQSALIGEGFIGRLSIMQSNGGVMAPDTARREPVRTMESGPVGGAIAAGQLAGRLGIKHAVAFDMGGTTAKAALINDGVPEMSEGYFVGNEMSGHPVMLPVVDVIEVGAGGGSIAYVDSVGSLQIGPQSAGGYPGPICYGWGGVEPTVTDANAILGRLNPDSFLGGEMPLNFEVARHIIESNIASPLGISISEAAQAIVDVAVNKMALAVRAVSIEKGLDPRDCALIAIGGAGPLHAVAVARDLDIPMVIVPPLPGHYSAFGMLVADVRHDYVRTYFQRLDELDPVVLSGMIVEMDSDARKLMSQEGLASEDISTEQFVDLRYSGQEFTLRVQIFPEEIEREGMDDVRKRFDKLHQERYGHMAPTEAVEVVNVRLVGIGRRNAPAIEPPTATGLATPVGNRSVGFTAKSGSIARVASIWKREELAPGSRIDGPAVIEEYASTIVFDVGDVAEVRGSGEIVIRLAERAGPN